MFDQHIDSTFEYFSPKIWFARFRKVSSKLKVQISTKSSLVTLLCLIFLVILFQAFSLSTVRGDFNTTIASVDRMAGSFAAAAAAPILIGAGDISSCANDNDIKTALLIQSVFATGVTGKVVTTGDNVYESGSLTQFTNCFHPTWGRFGSMIAPAVGNHEYQTAGASGYFNYFGSRAGNPQKGYYSYNLGNWHIVVINSNCSKVGGCQVGSPQESWLRADLAANPRTCTLAYWHHALFSSGKHGNYVALAPIWKALYDFNADVVLVGHDHHYERFAPQTSAGALDLQRGIREFVVGTGGKSHTSVSTIKPNSQMRNFTTFGVLKLTLNPSTYIWQFITETGTTFDIGQTACH